MAIVFGKRSSYLWNKAWGAMGVFALLLLLIVVISFLGPVITKLGYVGLVVVIGLMGIFLSLFEKRKKIVDRWVNGIEGEGEIVEELKKLPDNYVVIRGLKVKEHLDVDCTVVGPNGVFAIEVKSHKGKIEFDGQVLTRNGRRFEKDFLRQVTAEAFGLRDKIRNLAKIDLYVEAVLVFSNKYASVNLGQQMVRGCRVIGRDWLNNILEMTPGQKLENSFIFKIVSTLVADIADNKKDKKLDELKRIIGT